MCTRQLVAASTVAWLLAGTLVAQQPAPVRTGSVSGDVVDETGQPVRNVTVVLFSSDEAKWDTAAVNNALLERYQSQAQKFVLIAREHRTIEIQMIR